MESLAREQLEAVFDELPVFGIYGALSDLGSVIPFVIEERMAYPVEMHPYLMCPSGFEPAFHDSDISESFYDPVMSDGMLPVVPFREHLEPHPV